MKTKYETHTFKWKFNTWWKGTFSFWEAFFHGHISVGPITIFGANAMNWVVNIKTKKYGVICFTLPVLARIRFRGTKVWYFDWHYYCSPNGTPWASTYYIGHSSERKQIEALQRKILFGHNWDTSDKEMSEINFIINNNADWLWVTTTYSPEILKEKWQAFYNLKF